MSNYEQGKSAAFWQQYTKGRPSVPDSFFDAMLAYHTAHDGALHTLHEAGAGPGLHTARLASRFTKAIVTDISPQNIDVAKERNSQLSNCEFRAVRLEDETFPADASVDFLVCLNMLHLCDLSTALRSIHRQLKPGGTMAYGFFAWPAFPDNADAQDVLERMCRRGLAWLRDVQGRTLQNVALFVSNGDHIPSTGFCNVRRQRINFPEGFSWREMLVPQGLEFASWNGADTAEVERLSDPGWKFQMNVQDLRENLESHPWGKAPCLLDDLWPEMEAAMGGGKITAVWPVTCVLATKA